MKVFRDPVYNLISFRKKEDKPILDIIDTPEFQRLRRIRQLGFSCYTYPTATHDRFSHSLGVAYVIGQLFDNLEVPDYIEFSSEDGTRIKLNKTLLKLLIQLAGLLHDIGHGPFSHAFEKVANFEHEKISKELIYNRDGNIYNILHDINIDIYLDSSKSEDRDILDKKEVINDNFPYWIAQIICGGTFVGPVWVKDLLTSQFDADRIDYLLRDAYMCGVNYASFDLKWLSQNIEIGNRETDSGEIKQCLVINAEKGLHAVESFIISRYHMYEQVYFHKATRGLECIFEALFKRVKELHGLGKIERNVFINDGLYKIITTGEFELRDFLTLDDFCIYTQIQQWSSQVSDDDGIMQFLCNAIVNRNIYKCIRDSQDAIDWTEGKKVTYYFTKAGVKEDYFLLTDKYNNVPYKDSFVLGDSADSNQIMVNKKGKTISLSELSPIVDSLKNKKLRRIREYAHRDHAKNLYEILNPKT